MYGLFQVLFWECLLTKWKLQYYKMLPIQVSSPGRHFCNSFVILGCAELSPTSYLSHFKIKAPLLNEMNWLFFLLTFIFGQRRALTKGNVIAVPSSLMIVMSKSSMKDQRLKANWFLAKMNKKEHLLIFRAKGNFWKINRFWRFRFFDFNCSLTIGIGQGNDTGRGCVFSGASSGSYGCVAVTGSSVAWGCSGSATGEV